MTSTTFNVPVGRGLRLVMRSAVMRDRAENEALSAIKHGDPARAKRSSRMRGIAQSWLVRAIRILEDERIRWPR